jgi:hypothetical protein
VHEKHDPFGLGGIADTLLPQEKLGPVSRGPMFLAGDGLGRGLIVHELILQLNRAPRRLWICHSIRSLGRALRFLSHSALRKRPSCYAFRGELERACLATFIALR